MAAPHKCEGCFQVTTAERWTCDECYAEGRAAQLAVAREGGNMTDQVAAFQLAVSMRAQRVREQQATVPRGTVNVDPRFNPVPAGKVR